MSVPYVFDGQTEAGGDDDGGAPVCESCGAIVTSFPEDEALAETICADCAAEADAVRADQAADLAEAMTAVAAAMRWAAAR